MFPNKLITRPSLLIVFAVAPLLLAQSSPNKRPPTLREIASHHGDSPDRLREKPIRVGKAPSGEELTVRLAESCNAFPESSFAQPHSFVEIWEDMGGKVLSGAAPAGRLVKLRAATKSQVPQQTGQASIDLDSLIRIRLDLEAIGVANLLNRFEVKAELVRLKDAKTTPLPVSNFAEIAEDPAKANAGLSLATVQDQINVLRGLYDTANSLLKDFPLDQGQVKDPTVHLREQITPLLKNWQASLLRRKETAKQLEAAQKALEQEAKKLEELLKESEALEAKLAAARKSFQNFESILRDAPRNRTAIVEEANAKAEFETLQIAQRKLLAAIEAQKLAQSEATQRKDNAVAAFQVAAQSAQKTEEEKARVDLRIRILRKEIEGIVKRIQDAPAGPLTAILLDVFGMPAPIVSNVGTEFVAQLEKLLSSEDEAVKDSARAFIMLRTATVWNDFAALRAAAGVLQDACALPKFEGLAVQRAFEIAFADEARLLGAQVPEGIIDIPAQDAKDGDIVNLTFISRGADLATGPIGTFKMRIEVRDYRVRTSVLDSLMFIRRHHSVVDQATDARHDKDFRPSPGVSLLTTFHFRDLKWVNSLNSPSDSGYFVDRKSARRLLGALSPGVGVNASLLGFKATDKCLAPPNSNKCVVTDGPSFQIGVGPMLSLFDGALQFTYGWNLSLQSRPAYFGVGFSFLQLIEKGTKLARQARAASALGK